MRTVAVIGLPLAIGGIMLAMARPNGAQDRPGTSAADRNAKSGGTTHTARANSASAAQSDLADDGAGDDRRPLTYYAKEVRGTMFSAPQPPPPKPVITKVVVKPVPQVKVIVPPINPYASYAYTGTVKMGDQMMALVENTSTKDGQYLKIGDPFQGGEVSNITDQMVTLTQGGKPYQLAKSDNIVITPLNAPPQTAQPGGPPDPNAQPGGPQFPGGGPGGNRQAWRQMMMQGMQNGPTVTLPNGQVMSADRAARRAQFMNRRFDQGGGNGQ